MNFQHSMFEKMYMGSGLRIGKLVVLIAHIVARDIYGKITKVLQIGNTAQIAERRLITGEKSKGDTMSRFIDAEQYPSREWMIDFLYDCGVRADIKVEEIADELLYILSNVPTADVVELIHGEWIIHRNAEISHERLITNYECSICHTWSRYHSNYCPDCGAKMDLKEVKE